MNVAHLARVDLSFGMGMCENKCESDRDSLLIVVKVFSLRSARSFTSTCQLLHTHQPVAKSSLVQGNGVKYFLTENSYFHSYNTGYSRDFSSFLTVTVSNWMFLDRARPDWAYEFPDRTGPDTQICRTGPAGPDWIRTYISRHFTILKKPKINLLTPNMSPGTLSDEDW